MPSSGRTALYRLYDASDSLLYAGIADVPERRWREHSKDKWWWNLVARKTVEWYETRRAAEAAERQAILTERPSQDLTWHGYEGRRMANRPRDPFCGPLAEQLQAGIENGQYPDGHVFVLSAESAAEFGVSFSTLGSALGRLAQRRSVQRGKRLCSYRGPRLETYLVRADSAAWPVEPIAAP